MKVPEDADRDFAAGCIVVRYNRVLLLKHSKLGMWLQPGGHIEERETPDETARRETLEETGIEVEFHEDIENSYDEEAYDLPLPFRINVHKIRDGHWHCSMLFLASVKEKRRATHSHEHDGQKWFTREELENEEYEMPENLRQVALDALEATG